MPRKHGGLLDLFCQYLESSDRAHRTVIAYGADMEGFVDSFIKKCPSGGASLSDAGCNDYS